MINKAGMTTRVGRVEDGNTVMDFEPEELKRQASLSSGFFQLPWKKHTISLIDTPGDQNCSGLDANWQADMAKVVGYQKLTSPADMKNWLATHGSISGCFVVYQDFFSYSSGVYRHVSGEAAGGHCVEIIGYDERGLPK